MVVAVVVPPRPPVFFKISFEFYASLKEEVVRAPWAAVLELVNRCHQVEEQELEGTSRVIEPQNSPEPIFICSVPLSCKRNLAHNYEDAIQGIE